MQCLRTRKRCLALRQSQDHQQFHTHPENQYMQLPDLVNYLQTTVCRRPLKGKPPSAIISIFTGHIETVVIHAGYQIICIIWIYCNSSFILRGLFTWIACIYCYTVNFLFLHYIIFPDDIHIFVGYRNYF